MTVRIAAIAGMRCTAVALWTWFGEGEGTAALCGALRGARWFLGCGDWGFGLQCAHLFGIIRFVMIAPQATVDVQSLERRIRERNARIDAETAELARDLAVFDDHDGWRGTGRRDCVDWVTCNLGRDRQNAKALMLAAHAARELPELGEAFAAGELSVDKLRLLAPVVAPEDQGGWVQMARESSPAELARRCREHRSAELIGPERDRAQRAQRRLHTWFDELNMFRISGALPPEEGAMIQIALDRAGHELDRLRAADHIVELDPADDPFHARQADALVALCTDAMLGDPRAGASSPPVRMVVHVDYDVLTGANPNGRGHIENGPALSTAALRRLGCDATVKTLIERDGVPIAAGREKPAVSPELKLRVQSRDGTCLVPGCAMPSTRCDVHHIHHREDGGPTEHWNLGSACEWHHNRHHLGEFDIIRTPEGNLRFVTWDGRLMGTVTGGKWKRPKNRPGP
jgi:hypothetical protein